MTTTTLLAAALAATAKHEAGCNVNLHPRTVEDEHAMLATLEHLLGEAPPVEHDGALWREWVTGAAALLLFRATNRNVPGVPGYEYGPAEEYCDGRLHVAVYEIGTDKHVCEVEGMGWMEVHLAAHYAIRTITDEEAGVSP